MFFAKVLRGSRRVQHSVGAVAFFYVGVVSGIADASETCAPEAGGSHEVTAVIDGETLLIDDGREVRLIGALAPKPDMLLPSTTDFSPARDAMRALESIVLNRTVSLRHDGRRRDRYGRVLAQVYVEGANGQEWVQRALINQGLARAYALPGNIACAAPLIAAEADARLQRRGLWNRDLYRVRLAEDVEDLLRLDGRFVIVEGVVANVAHVQKTTYINFGADWWKDFTASLATPTADRAKGTTEHLSGLAGKTVRVRGWIERRNGPMIVLVSADEIEVVDQTEQASPDGMTAQPNP